VLPAAHPLDHSQHLVLHLPACVRAAALLADVVTMFRTQPLEFDYWVEDAWVSAVACAEVGTLPPPGVGPTGSQGGAVQHAPFTS